MTPRSVTGLTPDEVRRVTVRWTIAWGQRIPSASRLASDGTDDVLITDEAFRWTVVLRNGVDVLTTDRTVLDLVSDLVLGVHPEWSG